MSMGLIPPTHPFPNLRMMADKDTGKPKGYAFCEYYDRATAESAVRNLNQHDVSGRTLRVDFAEDHQHGMGMGGPGPAGVASRQDKDGRGGDRGPGGREPLNGPYAPAAGMRNVGVGSAASAAQVMASMLGSPGLASGAAQDGINSSLGSLSPLQLFEIMAQMKTIVQQNPTAARQALVSQPELTRALFQAQILLGMVKPLGPGEVLPGLMTGAPNPNPPTGMGQWEPLPASAIIPPQIQPPSMQQQVFAPPQPMPPAPAPLNQSSLSTGQQQALLDQLLRLTPEQLEALPPIEKQQAIAIISAVRGT